MPESRSSEPIQIEFAKLNLWNISNGIMLVVVKPYHCHFNLSTAASEKTETFLPSKNSLRPKKAGNLRGNKVRLNDSFVAMRGNGEPCTHTHTHSEKSEAVIVISCVANAAFYSTCPKNATKQDTEHTLRRRKKNPHK